MTAHDLQVQARRLAVLVAGAVASGVDPAANSTGAEDFAQLLRECVTGERRLGRFAALTRAEDGGAVFVYASFYDGTLVEALELGKRHAGNDVFSELPLGVLDLDLGLRLDEAHAVAHGGSWVACVPHCVTVSA